MNFSNAIHETSSFVPEDYSLISSDHQRFSAFDMIDALEIKMRKSNDVAGFGFLFTTGAALVSPMHELITQEKLYHPAPGRHRRSPLFSLFAGMAGALERWRQRQEQRRTLAMLSDHLLQDVGLTRQDVENELRKPLWR